MKGDYLIVKLPELSVFVGKNLVQACFVFQDDRLFFVELLIQFLVQEIGDLLLPFHLVFLLFVSNLWVRPMHTLCLICS